MRIKLSPYHRDLPNRTIHSFRGSSVTEFLEWLTPSALASLKPYSSTLTVLLNANGGIIDDTIVTKHSSNAFYVVTNAGRREQDLAWFKQKIEEWNAQRPSNEAVEHEVLENWGLVALQGLSPPFYGISELSTDSR